MLAEDLETYLDFVSDLAFNPRLDPTRVNEQKEIILREITERRSDPTFKDMDTYYKTLLKNSPETYFIGGKEEVINNATPDDLRAFHSRGYHANNMDLIFVGGLPSNIEDIIKKYFELRPTGSGKKFEFPTKEPLEDKTVIHINVPELYNLDSPKESNAQIRLGFIVPYVNHEDSYALSILNGVLGSDSNSRLFKTIRDRKGLAYGIYSFYNGMRNRGVIEINGNIISRRYNEVIEYIFDEMQNLKSKLVPQSEVQRLIRLSEYNTAKQFETNEGHIGEIEIKLDYGITSKEFSERLSSVTPEKVREVANKYLPSIDGNYVLMIRDPLKK